MTAIGDLPARGISSLRAAFAAQASETPGAIAVADGPERVTYRQLALAASAIRDSLDGHGIGPGSRIGISLHRSWRLAAAIVAILQHGCTYVPLDPGYPAGRLEFMARDSGVSAVCTEPGQALRTGDSHRRVDVSGQLAATVRDSAPSDPAVPAYIIYTSGSTGQPKGVAIAESAVVALFASAAGHFRFTRNDVWTMLHSYSFDFSVWELWGALLSGGRLVIAGQESVRDPRRIAELIGEHGVTVLSQVPSAFKTLVWALDRQPRELPSLRYIIFGGEEFDRRSARRWIEAGYGTCALVNMYGITETTVHATCALVGPADLGETGPTRIGRPLAHLRAMLLDERDRPVADGEPGQLHLSGPSLALGYVNQPELTEQRFPWLDLGGARARWYRTGDLARARPDGQLEYVGRTDSQVQLNGFRIELGEVEVALRSAAGVADAMAAVSRLAGGEASLVAYVVPSDPACAPTPAQLRAHCLTMLPGHLVPDRVRYLAALPLTPSGKLDRGSEPAAAPAS